MKKYWLSVIIVLGIFFLMDIVFPGDSEFFKELNLSNALLTILVGSFIVDAITHNDDD